MSTRPGPRGLIDFDAVDAQITAEREADQDGWGSAGYDPAADASWQRQPALGPCGVCDFNPNTTDGPQQHCPVHGQQSRWVDYDRLSVQAQQAIQHWTPVLSPEELIDRARDFEWQEEFVYTAEVIRRVMAHGDHAADFDGDWTAYHAWYLSRGGVPDHGASRWPVIEAPEDLRPIDGYLDDGWHRLHSYVAAGDVVIPVLRHRPQPATD